MNRNEQMLFINELCDDIKAGMIHDLPKVPEEWDGFELRHWIADRFKDRAVFGTPDKARVKRYRNTALVNNL